jgi:hypothetical protein
MGRSRYRICHEQAPHFLSCTVLNWNRYSPVRKPQPSFWTRYDTGKKNTAGKYTATSSWKITSI